MDLDLFMRLFDAKFDVSRICMNKIGDLPVSVLYDLSMFFRVCCLFVCFLFVVFWLCLSGIRMLFVACTPRFLPTPLVLGMAHLCFCVVRSQKWLSPQLYLASVVYQSFLLFQLAI